MVAVRTARSEPIQEMFFLKMKSTEHGNRLNIADEDVGEKSAVSFCYRWLNLAEKIMNFVCYINTKTS